MQFDSLIDWIKLPFISSHARSKHFSTVSVFCSFCLACFLPLLLVLRTADGIQKGHWFPKAVEVNIPGREYQSEDAQCGEGKGGQWQGGCFLKGVWTDLTIKEVRDTRSASWHWKGWIFLNCLAEHLGSLQVTQLLKTRPVVSLKILLHWPHSKLTEVIGNVSHGSCGLWKGLKWACVRLLVVKPACRKSESSATGDCSIQTLHPFWSRLPQGDAKSLLPLHLLPHTLSPARIWIKPWRELSVRDDFPVIIAWVRDYALFFCRLPYLQSRTHWAHVQLIHSSSKSRSNYRVRCKFNYSTCRKQKRNLIVKFVLLHRKDKKQKKDAEVACVSWIHFTPQSWREMNSDTAAEASLDRILLFFPSPYSALWRAAESSSPYARTCAIPILFPGSVLWPFHFHLKVVSWDENQGSWTLDSGTSRSLLRQMVFLKGFVLLDLAQLKLLGELPCICSLFPAVLYNAGGHLSHGPISLLGSILKVLPALSLFLSVN